MTGGLILVLGGVRSGKSRFAEEWAARHRPVIYIATAQADDAEMSERVARHRQRRPADWQTIEEPWALASAVADLVPKADGCVLVDCLGFWLSNLLLGMHGNPPLNDEAIRGEVEALAVAAVGRRPVLVVSHEVGWGGIAANPLARRFADLLGEANQRLAATATEVHVCLAGIPVRLK